MRDNDTMWLHYRSHFRLHNQSWFFFDIRPEINFIGFIGPGLALLCLNYARTPEFPYVVLTFALSLSSFSQAGFLLNIQLIIILLEKTSDTSPQSTGLLHGIGNSVGTLASIICTIGTGYFVQWLGSFQAFMTLAAIHYFISTIFYNLFANGERLF